jgi:hypothetical protein
VNSLVRFGWFLFCASAFADSLDTWAFRFSENNYYQPGGWARHYDTAFGNGSFVVVGHLSGTDYGTIFSSPDGITWTRRSQFPNSTSPTYGELRTITFGAGLFVAAGRAGIIYTSPDAVNWTQRTTSPVSTFAINDVGYRPGLFIAVGDAFEAFGTLTDSNVLTSSNGIDWVPRRVGNRLASQYFLLDRVACGETNVVATGQSYALVSPDGTRWTTSPPVPLPGYVMDLVHANGLYVAVGQTTNGNAMILTSPNGFQWTSRDAGVTNRLLSVTYGMGMFLATGEAVLLRSINGIDWSPRPSAFYFHRSTFGNGRAIAIHEEYDFSISEIYQSGPILHLQPPFAGQSMFTLHGPPGQTVRMETSEALASGWQFWRSVTLGAGPYLWSPDPPLSGKRFYRAVAQ